MNPSLFVPLAFRPEAQRALVYRAATTVSFACMSTGTVAAAVWLL